MILATGRRAAAWCGAYGPYLIRQSYGGENSVTERRLPPQHAPQHPPPDCVGVLSAATPGPGGVSAAVPPSRASGRIGCLRRHGVNTLVRRTGMAPTTLGSCPCEARWWALAWAAPRRHRRRSSPLLRTRPALPCQTSVRSACAGAWFAIPTVGPAWIAADSACFRCCRHPPDSTANLLCPALAPCNRVLPKTEIACM